MSLRTFLYEYPFLAIGTVLWVIGLVTFATLVVFTSLDAVSAPVAAAYGSLVGLPSVVFGFYQWRMTNKECNEKNEK